MPTFFLTSWAPGHCSFYFSTWKLIFQVKWNLLSNTIVVGTSNGCFVVKKERKKKNKPGILNWSLARTVTICVMSVPRMESEKTLLCEMLLCAHLWGLIYKENKTGIRQMGNSLLWRISWCLNSFSIFEIDCIDDRGTKMYNMMCDVNDHQKLPTSPHCISPSSLLVLFPCTSSIIFNIQKFLDYLRYNSFSWKKKEN